MRADARKNYDRILAIARDAFAEQGSEVSMRDIARQADVGLATLLRHFPSRDALFEALLCTELDMLTRRADDLARAHRPGEALATWLRIWMEFAQSHRGVVALMAAAHANPGSALYASCAAIHAASDRLLRRAQDGERARTDMTGDDLFALMTALGWAIDQPSFAPRADNLAKLLTTAILGDSATD